MTDFNIKLDKQLSNDLSTFLYGNYRKLIQKVYNDISTDLKPKNLVTECETTEERRKENVRQMRWIAEKQLDPWFGNVEKTDLLQRVFTMMAFWDAGMIGHISVTLHQLFCSTIESLGTEEFHGEFFRSSQDVRNLKTFGCFALTELTHGSDTRNMQTRATYNPETQHFDLHSPSKDAVKIWIGNLGKHATHALVAAQLYIQDKCYGLQWFVVPVRHKDTHKMLPRVIVGDLGKKTSTTWDAMDNGFLMFDHLQLPRSSMLNKYQEVTPEGEFVVKVKDKNTLFGLTLGALSGGRVGIAFDVVSRSRLSLCIAIRYSHARKQFGNPNERPVISYQYQQFRLMPRLASYFCMHFLGLNLHQWNYELRAMTQSGDITSKFVELNGEMHVLSCGFKAVSSWHARDTMQICRESCGGHGFAAFARLTALREDLEPSLTYEGENNVILLQVAKYLLNSLMILNSGKSVSSPLGSLNYINDVPKFFNLKCTVESSFKSVEEIRNALKWKSIYLLVTSAKKVSSLSKKHGLSDAIDASQAFFLHDAVEAHFNYIIFEESLKKINNSTFPEVRQILTLCTLIFGLWSLIGKDASTACLLEGGYFTTKQLTLARNELLDWCLTLAESSLSLVDAVCPPDEILQSVIATEDLDYTTHIMNHILQDKNVFQRSESWIELKTPVISKL